MDNSVTFATTDNKSTISFMIQWLRVPLTLLVVFVHISTETFQNYDKNAEMFSLQWSFTYFVDILYFIASWAVPSFFVISGYLFLRNIEKFDFSIFRYKYIGRFHSLLIPYLFWNLLVLIWSFLIFFIKNGTNTDVMNFWRQYDLYEVFVAGKNTGTPVYMIMWYVRDLIFLTLISPVFYFLIRYLKFVFVLSVIVVYVLYGGGVHWLGTLSIVFFSVGAWFGISQKNICALFESVISRLSLMLAVFTLFFLYPSGKMPEQCVRLLMVMGVFSLFYIAFYFSKNKKGLFPIAASSSFFVYCMHIFQPANKCTILIFSTYVLNCTIGTIPYIGPFVAFMFSPILTFVICFYIFVILKKISPRLLTYICGTR